MRNILFVDDEPNVLDGLRRMLRPMRHEWRMTFAQSGDQALEVMEEQSCDVIVSDMRMPGMDGVQLLSKVMQSYPNTVRIALSGQTDMEMLLESVRSTHQFLAKPCDAETLKTTIDRACALREMLADESLRRLVSKMESLPSLPSLYMEIIEKLRSPDGSVKEVGEIVAKDIAMSAKVLQLVNSAFFGVSRHISSPSHAATLLGLDVIKSLVLCTQVFSEFDEEKIKGLNIETLWKHSVEVGALAKRIAVSEGLDSKSCDHALMAGLLHDVGKLVLATNLPQEYSQVMALVAEQGIEQWKVEQEVLGCTHMEVGAYLLGLWGLPNPILEALAYHHRPSVCVGSGLVPLTAVHVANALLHDRVDSTEYQERQRLDLDFFSKLERVDGISKWEELRDEMFDREETT